MEERRWLADVTKLHFDDRSCGTMTHHTRYGGKDLFIDLWYSDCSTIGECRPVHDLLLVPGATRGRSPRI